MKIKWFFFCVLLLSQSAKGTFRQLHFDDISQWKNTDLTPYVGDTVVFTQPLYVCNNLNRNYKIGLRRLFAPTNLYLPASAQYNEYNKRNNTATITLHGINDYHRTGEKIYNSS